MADERTQEPEAPASPPNGSPYAVALRLLDKHGPITAIAAFLIYFLTQTLMGAVAKQGETLETHVKHAQTAERINRFLLRSICLNAADNETERSRCLVAEDEP
jgi:lipopolysaccharide/colanic/teichoic acid biosynthesis glycosyltransferase